MDLAGRGLILGLFFASLALASPGASQEADGLPASLVADEVTYDRTTGLLVARGNVEVLYEGRVLKATAITYDEKSKTIHATGPIQLTDPEQGVVLAADAALSSDIRDGLIESAQLLIAGQLQLAASEVRRTGGRYTTLYRSIASSCQICPGGGKPTWALRASRVTQDAEALRIYFEDATLEVYGLPVAWLPRLSIPDPSQSRASGVLVPVIRNSGIYGLGLKVPYYRVLGPMADGTITPFFTTTGAKLFEGEYRQRFATGGFDFSGVVALDDGLGGKPGRGAAFAVGQFALPQGFTTDFDLAVASDDTFLQQFDYSDADLLTSMARVLRSRTDDYFELGSVAFQSLREDEDTSTIPFVLPEMYWRRLLDVPGIGGRVGVDAEALGIIRGDGQDVFRIGGDIDWRRAWTLPYGVQATAGALGGLTIYRVWDDPDLSDKVVARTNPNVNVELRWPFSRVTSHATHVIEPIAQVVYSDTLGESDVPNNDSTLVEFDETNLFSLNRFPGIDQIETGLRANIGLGYTRYDPSGWSIGFQVGRVIRADPDPQFYQSTGLAGKWSDVVTSVNLEFGTMFSLVNRAMFDTDLTFNRDELAMNYTVDRGAVRAAYVYLADGYNPYYADQPETNEFGLDARYQVTPNWEVSGLWRYDVATNANLRAGAGVTYGNDCALFDFSISRRYTSSTNVPASTSIGFSVRLAGLGGSDDWKWPANVCVARKS